MTEEKDRIDETIDPEKEDYLLIEDLLTYLRDTAHFGLSMRNGHGPLH